MTNIEAYKGDITKYQSDVIVNAANSSLLGGGGVDGAIHRAAGKDLLFACRMLGGAKTGEAKITDAFDIKTAKKIVHTVGPVYRGLDPDTASKLLAHCYRNSLDLASGFHSITFPAISTGIYGYPIAEASEVAVFAIRGWIEDHPETSLESITLIAYNDEDYGIIKDSVMKLK